MADKTDKKEERKEEPKVDTKMSREAAIASLLADQIKGPFEAMGQTLREAFLTRSFLELLGFWLLGVLTVKMTVDGIRNWVQNDPEAERIRVQLSREKRAAFFEQIEYALSRLEERKQADAAKAAPAQYSAVRQLEQDQFPGVARFVAALGQLFGIPPETSQSGTQPTAPASPSVNP